MKFRSLLTWIVAIQAFSLHAREMPVLPDGAKPQNWREVRALLEPLGWEIHIPDVPLANGIRIHRDLVYVTYGTRELKLDLYLPDITDEGSAPPLVIMIHGGGWKSGRKEHDASRCRWFAAKGYAAATIEYRLSDEAEFPAALHDSKAAVLWLRKKAGKYGYEPGRFAVFGGSAGAHLAGLVATTGPKADLEDEEADSPVSSSVQVGIVVAGPTDLTRMEIRSESMDPESNYYKFLGGSYTERTAIYERASPVTWISEKTPPLLIIGEYSLQSCETLLRELTRAKVYHKTFILSGGIHGHWNWEPWFTPTMKQAEQFLQTVWKPPS